VFLLVATLRPPSHPFLPGSVEESCGWTHRLWVRAMAEAWSSTATRNRGADALAWGVPEPWSLGLAERFRSRPSRVTVTPLPQQPPLRDRMLVPKIICPAGVALMVLLLFPEYQASCFFLCMKIAESVFNKTEESPGNLLQDYV